MSGHPHCSAMGNAPKATCSESWKPETVIYTGNTFPIALPGTEGQINRKTQKNGIFTAL